MYISEFVCGIFATLIVEFAIVVVCAVLVNKKKDGGKVK